MPELEEAIEEVRLSVIDHAYEMLKCLDIDELTSDEIRRKLELYDIKVEDMTDNWLPNGRFYRMYPSIKHNRTRQNALYAIAKSGGQFEGVWSTGFAKKSEYNFKSIQVLRHYEIGSDMDGYFYVSGNASRHSDNKVTSSASMALQSDILIAQALPAGYTYLYIPWPRPVYPSDSTYFYNVNMLAFDRLTFVEDCDLNNYKPHNKSYNGKYPASMSYSWKSGDNTPWRTPYWFDYHYMNDMTHQNPSMPFNSGTWPIHESGQYYCYDDIDDSKVSTFYNNENNSWLPKPPEIYESNQKELYSTLSTFPTKCSTHGQYRTSEPNRSQRFTFNDHSVDGIIEKDSIDENEFIDYTDSASDNPGPYRWDVLSKDALIVSDNAHHIKTYKPFWNEKTPFFDMAQQNTDDNEKSSLLSWFNLKQSESQPQLSNPDGSNVEINESIVSNNEPPVSQETFTSYDRPTIGKLDPLYVGYTRAADDSQGDNKDLSSSLRSAVNIYSYGEDDNIPYNPTMSYNLLLKYTDDDHGNSSPYYDNESDYSTDYEPYAFIEGDPCTGKMYVNLNESTHVEHSEYNYFTFKTVKAHRLWFSKTKKDVELHEFHNYLYKTKSSLIDDSTGEIFCSAPISVYRNPLIIGMGGQQTQTVGTLSDGQLFTVVDRSAGWLKIMADNISGWVHSKYTSFGVDELYKYSRNTSSLDYHILGIYNESGDPVNYDFAKMSLFVNSDSGEYLYDLVCDAYKLEITDQISSIDLNNEWEKAEATDPDDSYVIGLLNDSDYEVYKSFSNTGVSSSEASMTVKIYAQSKFSFNVKIMGCGEVPDNATSGGWDYPIVYVYDSRGVLIDAYPFYGSGTTSEDASIEDYATWNDLTISIPDRGEYEIYVSYIKDGSREWGLDRAYFAIKPSEARIVQYNRLNAAYIDFTVSKLDSRASNDNQEYLPIELGEGMWDTDLNQLYPKYMRTRDLVYGDEKNWWLPRSEYINRGYSFRQTTENLSTIESKSVNKLSESVFINLGIVNTEE